MGNISFVYKKTSLIKEKELVGEAENCSSYVKHLQSVVSNGDYNQLESSINLVSDAEIKEAVEKLIKEKKNKNLKYILVVGIGGSNLGTMAIYRALCAKLDCFKRQFPRMIFAETVDPNLIRGLERLIQEKIINPEEIIVNLISKSGGTTETMANFEVIYNLLNNKFKEEELKKSIVAITDYESKLWHKAQEKGFSTLAIPATVGGRFSVFSAVGLFPLVLAGVDIDKLLKGALNMRERSIKEELPENPALASAIILYLNYQKKIKINDNFYFNPELEEVGKWYRQLMGESIGKEKDKEGNVVNIGITPMVSIGSNDLHSVAQLYLGGPKDKYTVFVSSLEKDSDVKVPDEESLALAAGISGKDFNYIMTAIMKGVTAAYQQRAIPFSEIILPQIDEYHLGQYLQMKMMETMYLGHLFNINAFDQPNVEEYKLVTKKLLGK